MSQGNITRISISLPDTLSSQLDEMVRERGFESRSQAIAEMVSRQVTDYKKELGDEVMAGTITLLYDHSTPRLQKLLADLQHEHIREVISSLHVHLMHSQTMEVILASPASDVVLEIWGEDGQPLLRHVTGQTEWSGVLHASQDYFIKVVSFGSEVDYTLTVTIPPL